jgi:hypothetical protein
MLCCSKSVFTICIKKIEKCPTGYMYISRVQRKDSMFIHYVKKAFVVLLRLLHRILDLRANYPMRIRVRIGPPHPLACRKKRSNGGGPSDETEKTEAPCHSRCGTIKIPPCSETLSAEHRTKFCSPSPAMEVKNS